MKSYGKNAVLELLQSNITVEKLCTQKGLYDSFSNRIISIAKERGVKISFEERDALDRMADTKNHQGFVCFTTEFTYSEVEDILALAAQKKQQPFILICDGVTDPHNLGAMIRSAECMGVHGIIIQKNRSASVNETVLKVSAGAAAYVRIAKVVNINQTIEILKAQNIFVFAAEAGGQPACRTNLTGAIALVIGSEGYGVSQLTKKLCDGVVSIGMQGQINSLNASVATGILLYEKRRQDDANKT